MTPPRYWRDETGRELRPAIERYLSNQELTASDIVVIRAYLQQSIDSPAWDLNPHQDRESAAGLQRLRESAARIQGREDIHQWIHEALDIGIDPL
jgi:hypothetical protein